MLVTLLVVAASMYLPDHLMTIYRRIWYYVHGQGEGVPMVAGVGDVNTAQGLRGVGTARGEL